MEEPSDGAQTNVTFRGIMADGKWYKSFLLYHSGNWTYNQQEETFSANDQTPLVLHVPLLSNLNFIFNAGPQQGSVMLQVGENTKTVNLYSTEDTAHGRAIPFEEADTSESQKRACTFAIGAIFFLIGFALLVCYSSYHSKINWKRVEKIYLFALVPASFLFLITFSLSSNPFITDFWGYDGAVFSLIGKGWANGYLPYRDLFEHKGPLTFLIFLTGNLISETWGLFLVQCLFLSISLLGGYLIGKTLGGISKGIVSSIIMLFFFSMIIDEGALVEEFNLPFLMISTYLIVRYFNQLNVDVKHPPRFAFVHGITVASALCLRLTNCIAVCFFILSIVLFLLIKREFNNIIQNAVAFSLGFCAFILPFILYFAAHGALYDLIYGTLLFNFQYASDVVQHSQEDWEKIIIYLFPVILSALLSYKKHPLIKGSMILTTIGMLIWFGRISLFPHYYVVILPFVPIAVSFLTEMPDLKESVSYLYKISYSALVLMITINVVSQINNSALSKRQVIAELQKIGYDNAYTMAVKKQGSLIPSSEKDSVIAFNAKADWYLLNNIIPCYRHFNFQYIRNGVYDHITQEDSNFYNSLSAKWIVVNTKRDWSFLKPILDESYHIMNESYDLALYQRNF